MPWPGISSIFGIGPRNGIEKQKSWGQVRDGMEGSSSAKLLAAVPELEIKLKRAHSGGVLLYCTILTVVCMTGNLRLDCLTHTNTHKSDTLDTYDRPTVYKRRKLEQFIRR
jgi:hypothetical protein